MQVHPANVEVRCMRGLRLQQIEEMKTTIARSSPELTDEIERLSLAGRAARSETRHDCSIGFDSLGRTVIRSILSHGSAVN